MSRRHALILLLITLISAACTGPGAAEDTTPPPVSRVDWIDGFKVSSEWTYQVPTSDTVGTVVVDTAAENETGAKVKATWHDGKELRTSVDETRPPLLFPRTWTFGSQLFIGGEICLEAPVLEMEDYRVDPEGECGVQEVVYSLRILDLSSRKWRELRPDVPLFRGNQLRFTAPDGTATLLVGGNEATENGETVYRYDLNTGETTKLDSFADEASINGCGLAGKTLLYKDLGPEFPSLQPKGGQFSLLTDNGTETLLNTEQPLFKFACVPDGMLMWTPGATSMTLFTLNDTKLDHQPIGLPGSAAKTGHVRLIGQQDLTADPAVWATADNGTEFQLWTLHNLEWKAIGPPATGYDPPNVIAVAGDHAIIYKGGQQPQLILR